MNQNSNQQIPNHKQCQIIGNKKKPYNLEERTLKFAKEVIILCQKIVKDSINVKLIGQLVNSAGSVGANYREANEALSKKDFLHRMKIARKECKESSFWLELLKEANPCFREEINIFSKNLRN